VAAEQEIHSSIFGVKGKIDSTVVFEDEKNQQKVTAVELKTGKYESDSHKSQVRLYLMILDEVFQNSNNKHLLVYIMNDSKNIPISMIETEACALVQNRNILCKYKKNLRLGKYELPAMIKDDRKCQWCFSKDLCCANAITFDSYCQDNEKPNFKFFKEMEISFKSDSKAYFKKWIEYINAEQIQSDQVFIKKDRLQKEQQVEETKEDEDEATKQMKKLKRKIVLESALKMTKVSPTVTGFIVSLERPINKEEYAKIEEIEGIEHTVKELDEQAYVVLRPNVTSVVFTRGLVTKKNYWINAAEKKTRLSDLPALNEFEKATLQYIVEFKNEVYYNILPDALGTHKWEDLSWELQKEPFSNYSFSVMRTNIFQIVNNPKLENLKDVIVRDKKQKIDAAFDKLTFLKEYKQILEELSEEQVEAVTHSMAATNFHVIAGAPQTGKSTVLTALLQVLSKAGLKVLVVSSKNDMVDHLMLKLHDKKVSFVRITNSPSQVDPTITEKVKTASGFSDESELDEMLKKEHIYASTCLGCQNGILGLIRPFDV